MQTQLQTAQSRRNDASKAIGAAMGKGDKDLAEALKAEVAAIKADMPALEEREKALGVELDGALATLPNLPAEDVPQGADEEGQCRSQPLGHPARLRPSPRRNTPTLAPCWAWISRPPRK